MKWSRKFRFEIHNVAPWQSKSFRTRTLGTVQQPVTCLAEKLARIEEEVRQRGLKEMSTSQLYALDRSLFPTCHGRRPPHYFELKWFHEHQVTALRHCVESSALSADQENYPSARSTLNLIRKPLNMRVVRTGTATSYRGGTTCA